MGNQHKQNGDKNVTWNKSYAEGIGWAVGIDRLMLADERFSYSSNISSRIFGIL